MSSIVEWLSTGEAIIAIAQIGMLLLFWKVFKNMRISLPFRGWGRLRAEFAIGTADVPPGVVLRPASLRVGSYHTDMAHVAVDDTHVYLKRPFGSAVDGMLRIPIHRMSLDSPPRTSGPVFGLPVAGIFKVNKVDIWIGSPHAEQIIGRLPPVPASGSASAA